jgi:hypothetical protein
MPATATGTTGLAIGIYALLLLGPTLGILDPKAIQNAVMELTALGDTLGIGP